MPLAASDLEPAPGWVVAVVLGAQVVAAVALLLTAYLTLTDRLPRNWFFGVRTRRSRSSDAAWRHVHRRFAPFAVAGALVVLAGLAPIALTADSGPGFTAALLITDGLMLAIVLVGVAVAHRGLPKAD